MHVHSSIRDLPTELTGTHLWDYNLDEDFGKADAFIPPATHAEQVDAAALESDSLRDRQVRDCRLRRHLLSHCLGLPPAEINFIHDPKGRPRVLSDGVTMPGQLAKFSVATMGPAWLLAVSFEGEIGVAVELEDAEIDVVRAAPEVLGPEERQWFNALLPLQQRMLFLRSRALKEAYAKAVGLNLKLNPREVRLAPQLDGTLKILSVPSGLKPAKFAQVFGMRVGENGPRAHGAVVRL